jgi:hypothetical protein
MGSFSLSGGVEVFGFISPSNTTDQYPVIDPLYGIDGLRNVNTLSDLNLIPTLRRRAGMLVGVSGGTTYYKLNPPPWSLTLSDWSIFNSGSGGDFLPLSGGTVTGNTIFTNGVTANTFSAATYLGLPSDIYVSGFTYLDNTLTIERSSGNPNLFVTINDFTGLTINGDLNVTGNTIVDGLTANTISATTYQNLPIDPDTYITAFTYNNNLLTIDDNSGNTFNVIINDFTGLTINGDLNVTGNTIVDGISANTISATTYQNLPIDVFVTGGTFSGGVITLINNTGGTFSVSGISSFDTFVTGFSYSDNTFTISQNSGTTLTATINSVTGLTASTISAATFNGNIVALNGTSVTNPTYRTSLGGANLSPRATFGSEATGASLHRYIFDPVNQNGLVFSTANNGSVYIARGGIVAGGSGSIAQEIGDLRFYTLNSPNATLFSERMRLDHFGNLGIGTTSPSEKLDVVGKTKTSTLQVTSGATNGYILTSDVSGNGTWQQIPSFTGGTVTGGTNFTNGLTANTISASTYYNLPTVIATSYPSGSIQSFLQTNSLLVQTIAAGVNFLRGYYITIDKDISFNELFISVSVISAGNSINGIYSILSNGYPDTLLYTTAVFNNGILNKQSSFQTGTLNIGTYFVVQNSSSAAVFRCFQTQLLTNTANPFGVTDGANVYTGLSVVYTYTGTLPTTFPVGATTTTGALPYLLFVIS